MKCTCQNRDECINCLKYDECEDKPIGTGFGAWILVYMCAMMIGILILLFN